MLVSQDDLPDHLQSGTLVPTHDLPQELVRPQGALQTFATSAIDEATRSLPPRNFYDLIRYHLALSHAKQGDPSMLQALGSEHAVRTASEQAHSTASGLGRFTGFMPAMWSGGEIAKGVTEMPAVAGAIAKTGRFAPMVEGAIHGIGQLGLSHVLQGRPAAAPLGVAEGTISGGVMGALNPRQAIAGLERGGMQDTAQTEDVLRTKQQDVSNLTAQQRIELESQQQVTNIEQQQDEAVIRSTFQRRLGESATEMRQRIAKSEQSLQEKLGTLEEQKSIAARGISKEANRQVLRVQKDIAAVRQDQQEEAWAGVTQLGKTSTRQFTEAEVKAAAQGEFGQEYGRQVAAQQNLLGTLRRLPQEGANPPTEIEQKVLSQIPPANRAKALLRMRQENAAPVAERTWSAQDLIDASTKIGAGGSKSVKGGKTAPTSEDLPNIDARTVVARLLDEEQPGVMGQGRKQWADFLRDDALHRKYFRRGQFTDEGSQFLTDVVTGKASPSDRGYLDRLTEKLGYNPSEPLLPYARRLATLPTQVSESTSLQQVTEKQEKDAFAQLKESLKSEQAQGLSDVKWKGEVTRASLDREIKDLLARSKEEQEILKNTQAGQERQIQDRVKGDIGALKRQAAVARTITRIGMWPIIYVLYRRPLYKAFSKTR